MAIKFIINAGMPWNITKTNFESIAHVFPCIASANVHVFALYLIGSLRCVRKLNL